MSATGDGADVAWVVTLIHTPDGAPPRRYRLTLTATWSEPAELTCAASGPSRVRRFAAGSLVDAG